MPRDDNEKTNDALAGSTYPGRRGSKASHTSFMASSDNPQSTVDIGTIGLLYLLTADHPEMRGSPGTTTRRERSAVCVGHRRPGYRFWTCAVAMSGYFVRQSGSHSGREGFYTYSLMPVMPAR